VIQSWKELFKRWSCQPKLEVGEDRERGKKRREKQQKELTEC